MIVIGASAGGVEALKTLLSSLPDDLHAAVCVVLHTGASDSFLPHVLSQRSGMPAHFPVDGERIEPGNVYVAPPNRQMMVQDGTLIVAEAPKENNHRPAIDPLFRSAAFVYGPRVVGVVLTGLLDDGTAGLWELKRRGGIAVVQSPEDAQYPQMPQSAIASVKVDYVVPLKDMGNLLTSLCHSEVVK